MPCNLAGSLHGPQRIVALNLAHQRFLAPVVVAVANDLAVEPYAIDQQVNVFVLGVDMARYQVLVFVQAHTTQVSLADFDPLRIRQMFAWCGRQRDMQHGPAERGP